MKCLIFAALIACATAAQAAPDDASTVAELDTAYQAAVKGNDADTMARILHPDFVVVLGNGAAIPREVLLMSARTKMSIYEHQDEDPGTQKVRIYGDTAVVSARLWAKGTAKNGTGAFDYRVWFSDTYVRTPTGWRYAFGQASTNTPTQR